MFRSSKSIRNSTRRLLSSRSFSTSLPAPKVYHQADKKTFQNRITKAASPEADKICLAKFTASWCPPCKVLKPILEKMESEQGSNLTGKKIDLMEIDVDEQQDLAMQYQVRAMPTVIAFRSGAPVKQFRGALPEAQVIDFIKSL